MTILRSLVLVAALGGCGSTDYAMRARFDAYGNVDTLGKATPIVAKPEDVQVFYGTSPGGFTLRDNELKVEPGYGHRILGTVSARMVRVEETSGATTQSKPVETTHAVSCNDPNFYSSLRAEYGRPRYTKKDVVANLRQAAMERGGNAVIYVHSAVTDDGELDATCRAIDDDDALAAGWIVVLDAESPATPPAPPAPAPAPAATAASH